MEAIRESAKMGAMFSFVLGQESSKARGPINTIYDMREGDETNLLELFGEITPQMLAAYSGAFEAVAHLNKAAPMWAERS